MTIAETTRWARRAATRSGVRVCRSRGCAASLLGEESADARGENERRKGLGKEGTGNPARVGRGSHEENGNVGFVGDELRREHPAVHVRHGKIGDDEVDCAPVFSDRAQRIEAIPGKQHAETGLRERARHHPAGGGLVIDHENGVRDLRSIGQPAWPVQG